MKKILLATTALVATTGFAAAEMSWSGSANMGMTYSDNGTTKVHNEIDLGMAASGETDGGIGWKVEMGLDSNVTDAVRNTSGVDVGSVSISGDFGTIRVGAVSTAGTAVGIGDIGFDGSAIDAAAHTGRNAGATTHDVQWNYAMDDIALHVSTKTSTDDNAVAISWTSGSMAIAVSHAAAGALGGASASAMSVGTSVGGFAVKGVATQHSTASKDSIGLSASMPVDGLGTVTFITGSNDTDAQSSMGVGFSKALGGGATLKGYYGTVNGNDVADLGINLSF
ncbi:porin [bacterium]|nr:porin [bacterium]